MVYGVKGLRCVKKEKEAAFLASDGTIKEAINVDNMISALLAS